MKNEVGKIIYVGKAKNLRARVRSYFSSKHEESPKTRVLVYNVRAIDFLLAKTEVEAFLLEASLIKKHRPKYNIRLRDDKAYPYVRVSVQDDFPRFYLSRRVQKDGSLFFGPFTRGRDVYDIIKFLSQAFLIRDCRDTFMKSRKRPCLTHEIGRCKAPCVQLVTKVEYRADLDHALLFLRGKDKDLLRGLKKEMNQASQDERYELAAKHRDNIRAIERILSRQVVVHDASDIDQDVIGYYGEERGTVITVTHIRRGRIIGHQNQFLAKLNPMSSEEDTREWFVSFINQYYLENIIPDEILLGTDLGNDMVKLLQDVLFERSGHKILIRFPTDEYGSRMLEVTERNSREEFKNQASYSEAKLKGLEEIKRKLGLEELPHRIECFDISHFQGKDTVASQVVFEEGLPAKDQYRRYKIQTVEGNDDFASMKEVLSRRFKHSEYERPQLLVIDGGKGQLSVAVEVLKEIGIADIPVVGLAKARTLGSFDLKEVQSSEERIFLPGRQNPVTFATGSEALHILVGIRDEAHRFAITYHRKLREETSLESSLDVISGLGEKRKQALLKTFESIDHIKSADVEELARIKGFNRVLAERILLHFNVGDDGEE